jgi:hypothetical protein
MRYKFARAINKIQTYNSTLSLSYYKTHSSLTPNTSTTFTMKVLPLTSNNLNRTPHSWVHLSSHCRFICLHVAVFTILYLRILCVFRPSLTLASSLRFFSRIKILLACIIQDWGMLTCVRSMIIFHSMSFLSDTSRNNITGKFNLHSYSMQFIFTSVVLENIMYCLTAVIPSTLNS